MTTSRHTHRSQTTIYEPFFAPVAAPERPAAHGNICRIDRCRCGAERHTNINGAHIERGRWT